MEQKKLFRGKNSKKKRVGANNNEYQAKNPNFRTQNEHGEGKSKTRIYKVL